MTSDELPIHSSSRNPRLLDGRAPDTTTRGSSSRPRLFALLIVIGVLAGVGCRDTNSSSNSAQLKVADTIEVAQVDSSATPTASKPTLIQRKSNGAKSLAQRVPVLLEDRGVALRQDVAIQSDARLPFSIEDGLGETATFDAYQMGAIQSGRGSASMSGARTSNPAPLGPTFVSLELSSPVDSVEIGEDQPMEVIARFSDASWELVTHQCTWNSTSPGVAAVFFSKFLIGLSPGTTEISATWGGMNTNSVMIEVMAPPPPPVVVTIPAGKLAVGAARLMEFTGSGTRPVSLENLDGEALRWRTTATREWIRTSEFVGQLDGFETRTIQVEVDANGLAEGDYSGMVSIVELNDPGTTFVVHVRLRVGSGTPLSSDTYYIDFVGGSDTSDGRSPASAWKRSPWDLEAEGVSGSTTLNPGAELIYKGGVHHRSQLEAFTSGTAGNRITIDGNTRGTFGDGPAILDGSQPLTEWTSIGANLYQTGLPQAASDVFAANLYAGETLLTLSQGPDTPADPYEYDNIEHFRTIPPSAVSTTSITDPDVLAGLPDNFWIGGYVAVWAPSNRVYVRRLTGYSASQSRITYEALDSVYTDRDSHYSILNCAVFLDSPGEYVVNEDANSVILWPRDDVGIDQTTVSVRRIGLDLQAEDHICIRGFRMIKYSAGLNLWYNGLGVRNNNSAGNGAVDIDVRDNEIAFNRCLEKAGAITLNYTTDSCVSGNMVHHNFRNRGLLFVYSENVNCEKNVLISNGSTGIGLFETTDSDVVGNELLLHAGIHANGITAYANSHNCTIVGNTVLEGNIALTTQDSDNLLIARNVLGVYDDFNGYTVADWGVSVNLKYFNNVIQSPLAKGIFLNSGSYVGTELRNCVIDGSLIPLGSIGHSHNIFTQRSWVQDSEPLGPSEFDATASEMFVDPQLGDFNPNPTSPGIDQGTDVGEGYEGAAPDIGVGESAP